jgi:DNA polymerase elongation subunit (family B)
MMKTDFLPIDYDYFDFEGKNYARIIGRNSQGKRICIIDYCDVYLWAILKDNVEKTAIAKLTDKIKKIKLDVNGRQTKVENVLLEEKNFLGKKVKALKIFATNYKDLHEIAGHLDFPEIEVRRGYDLGFITHYIIEKNFVPLNWYEISGDVLDNSDEFGKIGMVLDVDNCLKLKEKKDFHNSGTEKGFEPKALAYDIETDEIKIGEGEILMVSLVSKNFQKVITWKKTKSALGKSHDYVEYVKDEAELLERFAKHVKEVSPDFLVGYFSDGFDLPYLRARAEKLKVPLTLGLDGTQPRFFRGGAGKGLGAAKISGIVHIDLLKFIQTAYSQYMQSETLSLNEVAHEFLGDSKKKHTHQHSSKIDGQGWEDYYEYNLHDSVLTLKLFEKMWPDMLEFSRIMQEPIFDVSRNGMSSNVEDYITHNLSRFNEIPEKKPVHDEIGRRRDREKYVGAFVFEPTPGLYENVGVFDFTSFWPSIIVTFNLSRSTLLEKKEKDSVEAEVLGKKVFFSKKPGFFSEMLKEIIEKRKKYKKELQEKPDVIKKARSNAFKLLANASYGYQGFFGARYYCPEASGAATAISRDFIKKTIEEINDEGYKTIYSDTDSIAFLMNKKTESKTMNFLEKLNSHLPGVMELELEGFFKRGLWVTKREGTIGAKKKYALLGKDGKLKIRGFETVRRDWCPLARETQNKIIRLVLDEGNEKKALEYLKDIIKKIKGRKINKEELIIKTMLQKPLSEYKNITPHVIAARKMQERELPITAGNLIEYYIAQPKDGEKKKLVRERVNLSDEKGEYDIDYYLNKQVLPAAENIFQVFGVDVNEIIEGKKQMKLGDFKKD